MKLYKKSLALCFFALGLGCSEPASEGTGAPEAGGGGKADELLTCDDINDEYLECQEIGDECGILINEEYPDGGSCCGRDFEDYEVCEAYVEPLTCDDINAEYLECQEVGDECGVLFLEIYPDAGSCCGRDFEDYDLCEVYNEPLTCEDIDAEYSWCQDANVADDCGEYISTLYPDGGACCGHDFEDYGVCEVYNEPVTCEDIDAEYSWCQEVSFAEDCGEYITNLYPDGGACCGHDFEDYGVCEVY